MVTTRFAQHTPVLELHGRVDAHVAPSVRSWFDQHINDTPRIMVDLGDATFMDSVALATLTYGMKRCRELGGELALCNLQQPVQIIFELTRSDKVFALFPDEKKALVALNQASR